MRGKTSRQIRYVNYCEWALKIAKIWQEDASKHNNYLEKVLNYIHSLVPNDVKGEFLEDWYKVSLKEVQDLAKQVVGSQFWKIYCKKFSVKMSF